MPHTYLALARVPVLLVWVHPDARSESTETTGVWSWEGVLKSRAPPRRDRSLDPVLVPSPRAEGTSPPPSTPPQGDLRVSGRGGGVEWTGLAVKLGLRQGYGWDVWSFDSGFSFRERSRGVTKTTPQSKAILPGIVLVPHRKPTRLGRLRPPGL